MKMSDILHSIADMLDQEQGSEDAGGIANMEKSADSFQHDVEAGAEDGGAGDVEVGAMMAPLQQELELKKKQSGVDNAFDDQGEGELGDIKKLSGIKVVKLG